MTVNMDYADKIAKLLRKAESTTFDAERDALMEKAQHLMTVYAIDEAMLANRTPSEREEIIMQALKYTGIYAKQLLKIGTAIARVNHCQCVMSHVTWEKPQHWDLQVNGFQGDVRRVTMLNASLQVQCLRALNTWAKSDEGIKSWMSGMQKFKARRTFIDGFAYGVQTKLFAADRAGRQEAVKNEAATAGVDEAVATESVGIVLRARDDQVKDWVDQSYGKLRYVRSSYQSGGAGARQAGEAAGRRANTSEGISGGSRGELSG